MSDDVSVGIAIPSFEQVDFVRDALRSVAALDVAFTAIVQDGGSRDGTIEAIAETVGDDPRFEVVVGDDDGQSDAINRALARLSQQHPMVAWFNTDDLLHRHGFGAAVQLLAATPDAVAAYGDYQLIDERGALLRRVRSPHKVSRTQLLYTRNIIPGVATVIRSDAFRSVGGLDPSLHLSMDYDLWLRLIRIGRFIRVPHLVTSMRVHPGSKTTADPRPAEREMRAIARRQQRLPAPLAAAVGAVATPAGRAARLMDRWLHQ